MRYFLINEPENTYIGLKFVAYSTPTKIGSDLMFSAYTVTV